MAKKFHKQQMICCSAFLNKGNKFALKCYVGKTDVTVVCFTLAEEEKSMNSCAVELKDER